MDTMLSVISPSVAIFLPPETTTETPELSRKLGCTLSTTFRYLRSESTSYIGTV